MYYLISVVKTNSGAEARNLTSYDTLEKAKIRYHSSIAANMNDEVNVKGFILGIMNEAGSMMIREVWERAIIPEPVEESESPVEE